MTLERWERSFFRWARTRGWAESTLRGYRCWRRRFEAFLEDRGIGDLRLVDRPAIVEFLNHLMTIRSHTGRPYHPSSIPLALAWLRNVYRYLLEEGRILVDPTRGIPRTRPGRTLPKTVLTPAQMRRLLAAPDVTDPWGLRDRTILEVLYGSGIRFSELTQLKVGDVDLEEKVLWIRQGKGRKDRLLPLGRWASHWLGRYLRESAPLRRRQGTDRVFLTPKGRSLSNWVLNETIRRYAKAAGITRRVSAHALRHTFATQLIRGGADVRKVQRLLGHELLSTTQLYTHLDIEDLRKVQDRYHPRERRRR